MACLPQQPGLPVEHGDKVLHIAAFATLAVLAVLAFPSARIGTIFIGLACLGGLIEVVQSLPMFNRHASLADWLAGTVTAGVVLMIAEPIRRRYGPGHLRNIGMPKNRRH